MSEFGRIRCVLLAVFALLMAFCAPAPSLISASSIALPLSASDRWIVDSKGAHVRLSCVNWPTHMETMLPEGLHHNSANNIAALVAQMGFNCVRLSYSIDFALLIPNPASTPTARQSLTKQSLTQLISGFTQHNPTLIDKSVVTAFEAVVKALGKQNVMVLLDNHVSHAEWCCSGNDGNGWWGEQYFNAAQWLQGLGYMASHFKSYSNVVAMDLRNELRDLSDLGQWYSYMVQGLNALHAGNSNVLLFVSGLNYDTDLGFLYSNPIQRQVSSGIKSKLVYEAHAYSWSGYGNDCSTIQNSFGSKWGYLITSGQSFTAPLVISEWGVNVDAYPGGDGSFGDCVLNYLAGNGMSWGYWVLGGSYYVRNGHADDPESYGLLDSTWSQVKNSGWVAKFRAVQDPINRLSLQARLNDANDDDTGLTPDSESSTGAELPFIEDTSRPTDSSSGSAGEQYAAAAQEIETIAQLFSSPSTTTSELSSQPPSNRLSLIKLSNEIAQLTHTLKHVEVEVQQMTSVEKKIQLDGNSR